MQGGWVELRYRIENNDEYIKRLVDGLRRSAPDADVKLLETHISWVILTGKDAYKIKKAVNLGFLDFSTLALRKYYCEEEVRLNRRLSGDLYRGVVEIGGSDEPAFHVLPELEYAVHMVRFPDNGLMDDLARRGSIDMACIAKLGRKIAVFHRSLAAALPQAGVGTSSAVFSDADANFTSLQAILTERMDMETLLLLRQQMRQEFESCRDFMDARRQTGHVRECHGDLHLGNVVLIDEEPVPFDCIEFNPALRWIDVISEVAFLAMDLEFYGLHKHAWRFLNEYLEITGDYGGCRLLPFYMSYRAMVRAKIEGVRASQTAGPEAAEHISGCRRYIALAGKYLSSKIPVLVMTHGLPGSGKSTFAQMAAQRMSAIRIRSDVERKRLHGLGALESSAEKGVNLYAEAVSRQTYARLAELAADLLKGGNNVIVDAAFMKQSERTKFIEMASALGVPFCIASVSAPKRALEARVQQRRAAGTDASEADSGVLHLLRSQIEPLAPGEREYAINFENGETGLVDCEPAWKRLEALIG